MRVCDLHVCMCFCGHFDEEKNPIYQLFFFKKKLNHQLLNNNIMTSVPVYEKCTSKKPHHPHNEKKLPPKKCLCRPKIDLFLDSLFP